MTPVSKKDNKYFSVFYNNFFLPTLLNNAVKPIAESLEKNGFVVIISFNSYNGDNIRLAIMRPLIQENYIQNVNIKLNIKNIYEFLKGYPSPDNNRNFIGNELFMPFRNNTIRFNLFTYDGINDNVLLLKHSITKYIISFFKGEETYHESSKILLTTQILRTFESVLINNNLSTPRNIYDGYKIVYCKKRSVHQAEENIHNFDILFQENVSILLEMSKAIFDASSIDNIDIMLLKDALSRLINNDTMLKQGQYVFELINYLISEQLDITDEILLGSYYLIYKCDTIDNSLNK